MRTTLRCCLVVLALLGATALAEEWNKTYSLTGKPDLRVDLNDGNIQVNSADASRIAVHLNTEGWKIGPGDVRIMERQEGNRVEIEVRIPRHSVCIFCGRRAVRIEITVPRETNLDLHTGDGNVDVSDVKGEHRINTGDGNLELHSLDGALTARTGDGNIRTDGRFDLMEISTGDGNIEAGARPGSKLAGGWLLRTGDGHVNVRLPEGISADLDAHTGDGHIDIDFPVTVSGSMRESSVRGKINGGGPSLELRSGDGDIRIGRY